ncbi:MAG: MlaD family protein [Planctomycetaceae bacterium]
MSSSDETPTEPEDAASPVIATDEFPVANVIESGVATALLRQSRLWWVTLLCLILAVWLAWSSLPETGPEIRIQFPEGHGLKAGDLVRYRGIDVGEVIAVGLNSSLTGINVDVMLKPGAARLDREGTRFWIVRPRLSLTEVSGLETAVGAKYIGVSPGDPAAAHRSTFDGLVVAPPDELAAGGLELILRSNERHGISTGSPISWRGVEVGQVLSVNLSPDARHVDIGVRIDRSYRRLVRPSSKFWITSGFDMDIGLTGVRLNAQSLTTIVRGGISLITPADNRTAEVSSGQVFPLAEAPQDEWLKSAATVPFVDVQLPETVTVVGQRTTSFLGISRQRAFSQTGILISDGTTTRLLTAELPMTTPDGAEMAVLDRFEILRADGQKQVVESMPVVEVHRSDAGTMSIPVHDVAAQMASERLREPVAPEECLIVRSAIVDQKADPVIQAIDLHQITERDSLWLISGSDSDFSQWHGSPVVAVSDGRIIGTLIADSGAAVIVPYQPEQIRE